MKWKQKQKQFPKRWFVSLGEPVNFWRNVLPDARCCDMIEKNTKNKGETAMDLRKWFYEQAESGMKEGVIALNFNLYEEEEDGVYTAQLVGCARYDELNDDWACEEVFSSGEELYEFTADEWESAQEDFNEAVQEEILSEELPEFLSAIQVITAGFIDGELEVLWKA